MQAATLGMAPTVMGTKELFGRLFVPVDFTSASRRAVAVALELERVFGSRVCLFGVAEETGSDEFLGGLGAPETPSDLVNASLGRLRRFAENISPELASSIEVRARAVVKPAEEIQAEARSWNATLLVAATTFGGFFRSPAEKLVHGFDIPVLLIPAIETDTKPQLELAPVAEDWRNALTPGISRRRRGL